MDPLRVAEPEPSPAEVVIEDEPRYLRRQKPLEIRRRRFGRRTRMLSKRAIFIGTGVAAGAWLLYATAYFLLFSPRMALARPSQVDVSGNHHVSRAAVIDVFRGDRGRSVLRVPLEARRRALEQVPWVEQAVVRRALPNRLQVELVERTPVAFLRTGADLALVDVHGVILDRPLDGNFHFPVVDGIPSTRPREERERRMQLFVEFLKEIDQARAGASDQVSEADLSDAADVRATLAALPELGGQGPMLVHFGDSGFADKFRLFLDNVAHWRATAGRVDSVDLRFSGEVVVNPDSSVTTAKNLKPTTKTR